MQQILEKPLMGLLGVRDALTALEEEQGPVQITGAVESSKVHIMAKAGQGATRLVVAYDESDALNLSYDFRFFGSEVVTYPQKDFLFYQADAKSNAIVKARLRVLRKLIEKEPVTIITTVPALMNTVMPLELFSEGILTIREGDEWDITALSRKLIRIGYERVVRCENPGEFALHGGILDVYDLTMEDPIRIEFFDTEVDTIRFFNPESQVSTGRTKDATLFPATDVFFTEEEMEKARSEFRKDYERRVAYFQEKDDLKAASETQKLYREWESAFTEQTGKAIFEKAMPYFFDTPSYFESYLPKGTPIFINEPFRVKEMANLAEFEFTESAKVRMEKGLMLPKMAGVLRSTDDTLFALKTKKTLLFTGLDTRYAAMKPAVYRVECHTILSYAGRGEELIADLRKYADKGYTIVLLIESKTRGHRMAESLREKGFTVYTDTEEIKSENGIYILPGLLLKGFVYPMQQFVLITENDVFREMEKKKKKHKIHMENTERIRSFRDLSIGDYVVHENHGIGIYEGIKKIESQGVENDYMVIAYAGSGKLYVPITAFDVVQKYASADGKKPKLSSLDTPDWNRTKSHVKRAVEEIADELVELYYTREHSEGFDFGPDTEWQREFEETFPYEETEDQKRAISEVKADMESTRIMDRLLCGDVGFGKTEVAIRAAFKAVQDGKQVAYLVPTTILASQHYQTFTERMQNFPINVAMLSRFVTPSEEKKTIEGLKNGRVDIVIGTHKLLSSSVSFKDLGLLIIDEEQRFGVMHKEKIKQLRSNVDVLTLTATPIPRTLHMSMIGVRDMSLLAEAPEEREAIQTYVMEYDEEIVREAILREVSRGGQVYYVHNRAAHLDNTMDRLSELLPDVTFTYIHGKLAEREIDRRLLDFKNGQIDVLVSTTIIETGIDIPNVNTIIIEDSERYGLSQLYQLRGRVGRSNRQAYAFIMYQKEKVPNPEAEKRLEAIRQFTELGSGVQIALEDLELRGAGTVLGKAQSGHMMMVGYDLYCKLLSEAVQKKIVGPDSEKAFHTTLNIRMDAYIPNEYIENEKLKLEVYKRISQISSDEDRDELTDELLDRFGTIPSVTENLIEAAAIKALAHSVYMIKVDALSDEITFSFYPKAPLKGENIAVLLKKMHGAMEFTIREYPALIWREGYGYEPEEPNLLGKIRDLINTIKQLLI